MGVYNIQPSSYNECLCCAGRYIQLLKVDCLATADSRTSKWDYTHTQRISKILNIGLDERNVFLFLQLNTTAQKCTTLSYLLKVLYAIYSIQRTPVDIVTADILAHQVLLNRVPEQAIEDSVRYQIY